MKMDLALNNLQRLICHKTQTPNQTMIGNDPSKSIVSDMDVSKFLIRQVEYEDIRHF